MRKRLPIAVMRSPRRRSLLLLIDGRKLTGAQLLDKFAAFPNSAELLQVLEDGGLIAAQAGAPVPAAAASPSGSATVSAPAAVAQPGIAEAKRVIVRTLHDVLGPEADFLTEKIDVAQTAAELRVHAEKYRDMLVDMGKPKNRLLSGKPSRLRCRRSSVLQQ